MNVGSRVSGWHIKVFVDLRMPYPYINVVSPTFLTNSQIRQMFNYIEHYGIISQPHENVKLILMLDIGLRGHDLLDFQGSDSRS